MGRPRTKHKGLPPRFHFSCGGYYHVVHGKWHPLGRSKSLALQAYHERELGNLRKGTLTFRTMRNSYLKDGVGGLAERTVKDYTKHLALWGEALDHCSPEVILPSTIKQLHRKAVEKRGVVQGNREKAAVSLLWNWCRGEGLLSLPNPCAGIRRAKEVGRSALVSDTTYRRVWVHSDWPTRDALDLARYTSQRPADVFKIQTTDIKGDELRVKQGKTGIIVRIVLEAKLKAVVERLLARPRVGTSLLVNESGSRFTYAAFDNRFEDACVLAGVKFQYRDLRAKGGTAVADKQGKEAAQGLLGHRSVTTTEIYVQRRGKRVRAS